ncbi:MAG: LPS export ABC transporter periplasmic protein LptC [Desulfobacterales bacterium]|nr:MAG: LPS export ABC transporter periplasmic protein LptC [Desulfobacterales bacterium]
MAWTPYKIPKKIKLILLSIILITVGIIIVVYLGFRRISDTPELILSTIQDGANLSIGRIQQTATRDGKREWSLEATSAHYIETEKQVILKDLAVTFFLDDNSEVYLTAQKGVLNTDSNDIEVSGNVVIKKDNYRLTTEQLNYDHKQRIIITKVPVTISGNSTNILADSAIFDLNTKKVRLEGNVEGTLSADSAL